MSAPCGVINLASIGSKIECEWFFNMNGDLRSWLDVNRSECLSIELADPLRDVLYATGEHAIHGFTSRDANGAYCPTLVAGINGIFAVGLDHRCHANTGGGDQGLGAEVLLGIATSFARNTGYAVLVADPSEAFLARALVGVALLAAAFVLFAVAWQRANGAVLKHERDRPDVSSDAGQRPVA